RAVVCGAGACCARPVATTKMSATRLTVTNRFSSETARSRIICGSFLSDVILPPIGWLDAAFLEHPVLAQFAAQTAIGKPEKELTGRRARRPAVPQISPPLDGR